MPNRFWEQLKKPVISTAKTIGEWFKKLPSEVATETERGVRKTAFDLKEAMKPIEIKPHEPEVSSIKPFTLGEMLKQSIEPFKPTKITPPEPTRPLLERIFKPEILERAKEKMREGLFFIPKMVREKITEPIIRPMEKPEVRAEQEIIGGLKTFAKGLKLLPRQVASKILMALQGDEGASVVNKNWADRYIELAHKDIAEFVEQTKKEYGEKTFLPGIKLTEVASLPQNLAYSITSMGAALGVGLPVALIPKIGVPAAWTLAGATSAKVAYEMTTYEIMQEYLEAVNEMAIKDRGYGITAAEEKRLKAEFGYLAKKYGLWEALPEAISQVAFAKILTAPLTKMLGKTMAARIVSKLAAIYGEELATETITGMGQMKVRGEMGLPGGKKVDWTNPKDWAEALGAIAPQTFLLTTTMAGAGQAVVSTHQAITSLQKELGKDHVLYNKFKEKIIEIAKNPKKAAELVPPIGLTIKEVKPEYIPAPKSERELFKIYPKRFEFKERVPIDKIKIDKKLYSIDNVVNRKIVQEIVKDFEPGRWAPILVDKNFKLLDGQHRLEVAKEKGLKYIDVIIDKDPITREELEKLEKKVKPMPKIKPPAKAVLEPLSTADALKLSKRAERIAKTIADKFPPVKTEAEKELEIINEKAIPKIKAGKEIAPKQMRLDEVKPAPPGSIPPPPTDEMPLMAAPEPAKGSGLEAIDKMVEKVGKPRRLWEWLKGRPAAFKELFTDQFAAIKAFEDHISKMAGKPIDINKSPYVEARMYAGRLGTIKMNFTDLQNILKPIRKYRADFTRFVLSKRAIERANRGFKNPAGVTAEQASRALEEIRAKVGERVYALFETTEKAIQDWADTTILKPALETGIISKRAYEAIVTKNKHWMPFQVLDYLPTSAEVDMLPVGTEVFSVTKQGIIKELKGTEKTIRDPFEAIIDRMAQAVSLTKRNEVARKLIALREEFPAAKELIKPLARISIDKATGKKKLIWDLKPPKDWDSISVFINGKVTKWAVPQDLGWAMHQLNLAETELIGKFVKFTSAAFRHGATTLYIPFSLSNAFRDVQMAIMCSKWGFSPADWLKGFGAGLKGAFGWESKLYNDFHRNAGGYGGFIQSARTISGTKESLFTPSWWTKTKAVINPFNLISNFAEAIELAPRLGVFAKGLQKGATPLEAAYEARRVTVDFSRAGQQARIINQWIPFVNARWQALLNTIRVFREHPIRSAARVTALVILPGLTTYFWNILNHEDLYDDIPQWAKDTYFILIVGEDIDERGNRVPKIVQIPKGDVGQIFYNPIEYALEYVRKGEPENWFKLALEWMSQISPIPFTRDGEPSATSFLAGALPPLIRTPIELAVNQSFFMGYPIVPRKLERVAPSEQYDEETPQLAITIGRALGISPMKLTYGLQGMLGGFGREAIDPAKILELTVKRFYRTSGGAKRNEAWNLMDDLIVGYNTVRLQAKKAIEQGRPEVAYAIIREWNLKAWSVIPDITAIIAEDDPDEAAKIARKVTFQATDIARLKKTVQEEIAEIKKTPITTPKTKGEWEVGAIAPPTMRTLFPARPTEKTTIGNW